MATKASSLRIGVLGLGAMGSPMARHLLAERGTLTVHSRRRRQELVDAGARWAATPRELAEACDAILVMLPDLPQLDEQFDGDDGLLAGVSELLLMIGSTSSPVRVRELARDLSSRTGGRVRVVDCPVSGGEDGAKAGTLSIMVGGADDDAAQAAGILKACGTPVHLGPLGAGQVAKACNQMIVAATILALGEATVLADRSDIDLDRLWTLLAGGYAGSNLLASRREKLITGDDSPSGPARYMVKDLDFATDIAEATHTNTILLPRLKEAFSELLSKGLGDRDISVTRRLVAER